MAHQTGGPHILAQSRNLILSHLPEDQYAELARHLIPVNLPTGLRMGEPNQRNKYIYFPGSGLISEDALTEAGGSVEVGVTGREGFAGVAGLLNQPQMPHSIFMQAAGSGFKVRTAIVREEFLRGGILAELVHQFLYLQIVQASQAALCHRFHPVDARMARWMLTASDRLETDHLELTQEFLAQMLGTRRSTVTVAAGELQRQGLINYARGKVSIINHRGLEGVACECYQIVRAVFHRVLGRY